MQKCMPTLAAMAAPKNIAKTLLGFCFLSLTLIHQRHSINTVRSTLNDEIQQTSRIRSKSSTKQQKMSNRWWDLPSTKTIRSWGCDLQTGPLIFVHIGKAGGGGVRSRIAASAQNYTREKWHSVDDESFYSPMIATGEQEENNMSIHKKNTNVPATLGRFCNSDHRNFRASDQDSFEGTEKCHATTPIAQAISCPDYQFCPRCNFESETCATVYVGHNFIGSEVHWLPQSILSKWWEEEWASTLETSTNDRNITHRNNKDYSRSISEMLQTLAPGDTNWCHFSDISQARPITGREYKENYQKCSVPLQAAVSDEVWNFFSSLSSALSDDSESFQTQIQRRSSRSIDSQKLAVTALLKPDEINWSPIYASLPVLRTVVIREPFSWLMSKFFWHNFYEHMKCDNITEALHHIEGQFEYTTRESLYLDEDEEIYGGPGWLKRCVMQYITYLCGEDCIARYELGSGHLQQMEDQAASNLRHSFAVVGLLNETDVFYEMLTTRVAYMNTSLNQHVSNNAHRSGIGGESGRCKKRYADPSFQQKLIELSPEVAALSRLYKISLEVNRFQLNELKQCPKSTL